VGISSALGSSALLPAGLGFRNLVINGGLDIWQRGTSFSNPASHEFTADRFFVLYDGAGATRTISQGQFDPYPSSATVTATPPTGQSPTYFLRWAQSVAGSGATYNVLYANRIENVRLIAGQTVTLSFYAKAASNLTMPAIDIEQHFGSGGSPSANVNTTVTSNLAVTTSWQRFLFTFQVPSAAGKVIGTNTNSSFTSIRLFLPINTTFTFDIWGVQLEQNYQPTPFEQRPIGVELALCQRYYYVLGSGNNIWVAPGYNFSANQANFLIKFPQEMRGTPGMDATSGTNYYTFDRNGAGDQFNSVALFQPSAYGCLLYNNTEISGTAGNGGALFLSNASAKIAFGAEL